MDWHKVSCGKIAVIRYDVAEIMVDDGIDINIKMVDEIHHYLLSTFPHSFSLLINKSNSYSTQLDALIRFGALPAIDKIAIFAPTKMAELSANFSAGIPSSAKLDIHVFPLRSDAINWLESTKSIKLHHD